MTRFCASALLGGAPRFEHFFEFGRRSFLNIHGSGSQWKEEYNKPAIYTLYAAKCFNSYFYHIIHLQHVPWTN